LLVFQLCIGRVCIELTTSAGTATEAWRFKHSDAVSPRASAKLQTEMGPEDYHGTIVSSGGWPLALLR